MYKETYSRQELRDLIARSIWEDRRRYRKYRQTEFYKGLAQEAKGGVASLRELAQDLGLFDKRPTSWWRKQR